MLLAGNFGRNSETSSLIETYLAKTSSLVTITQDAVDCVYGFADKLLERPNTTLILSFAQAQKLFSATKSQTPLVFDMPLAQVVEALTDFTAKYQITIVTRQNSIIFISSGGRVVTTEAAKEKVWRVLAATKSAVWWLQNPTKPLEAISTSLII